MIDQGGSNNWGFDSEPEKDWYKRRKMKKPSGDSRFQYLDSDRGPYRLMDVTVPSVHPSLGYEWNGKLPPKGRSWRYNKETLDALQREGKIVISPSGMPRLKRYLSEASGTLYNTLHQATERKFDRERDFEASIIPKLVDSLGYSEEETFYQYGMGRYRPDVVLSESITSRPWVIIEIRLDKHRYLDVVIEQVRRYMEVFNCDKGVIISPDLLVVISPKDEKRFNLRELTPSQSEEIVTALFQQEERPAQPSQPLTQSTIVTLIESVENDGTNEQKGSSLEELAQFLFESVPPLRCKYRNLITRSSEIDLVIEYDRSKGVVPVFEEWGRYCLVECKNWSKPVGAQVIRDFVGKLHDSKVRLGVILSKNGITGVDRGSDAVRTIYNKFQSENLLLLVFSIADLQVITDGKAFAKALDRKADELRFDIQ
jgi:hypothetical protein